MKIVYFEEGEGEYPDFKAFRDMHPSAGVLFVDDVECVDLCEGCGKPILRGDMCQLWSDGPITCASPECSDQTKLQRA